MLRPICMTDEYSALILPKEGFASLPRCQSFLVVKKVVSSISEHLAEGLTKLPCAQMAFPALCAGRCIATAPQAVATPSTLVLQIADRNIFNSQTRSVNSLPAVSCELNSELPFSVREGFALSVLLTSFLERATGFAAISVPRKANSGRTNLKSPEMKH